MSDIHDLAAAYLLGELSPEDEETFQAHLSDCAACQDELADLEAGVEALFFASAEDAPPSLRTSVMAEITQSSPSPGTPASVTELRRPRRRRAPLIGAVAAAVVLIVFFLGTGGSDPIQDVITAPDAVAAEVIPTDADLSPNADVTLTYSEEQSAAVLTGTGVELLGEDQAYQMWLIRAGADPVSAGLFTPKDDGTVQVALEGTPTAGIQFGITVEPAGGSEQPTSTPIYAADL